MNQSILKRIEALEAAAIDAADRCEVCDGVIGGVLLHQVLNGLGESLELHCPACGEGTSANGCATHYRVRPVAGMAVKRIQLMGSNEGTPCPKVPHWKGDPRWLATDRCREPIANGDEKASNAK